MMQEYTPPKYQETAFHCPSCNVYANQIWCDLEARTDVYTSYTISEFFGCRCDRCDNYSFWHNEVMIYPDSTGIQPPNKDLPENIKSDYREAASILQKSPRGAAALLRLCVQKLCIHLNQKGENLNQDIKNLVEKRLPAGVQESLDAVRVIGNYSVHPGQINLEDNPEIAKALFALVNFIAEKMITEPKQLAEIYNNLPESSKEQINTRDNNAKNET